MIINYSELFDVDTKYRIGICQENVIPALTKNLLQIAKKHDLIIYGKKIKGLNCISDCFDPSQKLIDDYKNGAIDTFVRGINDDYTFQNKYKETFQFKQLMRLVFLRDAHGRDLCLGPVSASEAATIDERIKFVKKSVEFLNRININPRVAVMSACRKGSINYSEANKKSWSESELVVEELSKIGIEAENVGIEIEKSVGNFNFILPASGLIGNQIFRTLTFLGKGQIYGIPAFSPEDDSFQYCYEDNSRNEVAYESHIRAATLWASINTN